MDEFQGAAAVHRLSEGVPYRDFRPYKPVLGYYLQWPALRLFHGLWNPLLAVKLEMALAVALVLAWAAGRLARGLGHGAVLLALALLLAMSTFLERSAELRVDTLTALAGLISLVFLVDGGRRGELWRGELWRDELWSGELWSGGWAAVAFLVSQKGAFYPLAGGAALAVAWLVERDRRRFLAAVRYAAAGLAVAAGYYLSWALVAGGDPLADTVAPARRVLAGAYALRLEFWSQTVLRNPAFYLLAAAALVAVVRRALGGGPRREPALRLAVFGVVLTVLCAWYEQPWPYFFVLLLPTLAVLLAEGFDAVLAGSWWPRQPGRVRPLLVAGVLLVGVAYPLLTRVPQVLARDSGFQRYNVETAAAILDPGDGYLAGVALLWDRPQSSARLAWLDQRKLAEVRAAPPAELAALADELVAKRTKLVVWNYRIAALPDPLAGFLGRRFRHLTGNLFVYSPLVAAGEGAARVGFAGTYRVEIRDGGRCRVDGREVASGQPLDLAAGPLAVDCASPLRLTLLPPGIEGRLDPRYQEPRSLFPAIYVY